jgi:copper chaperone CopZ
MKKTYDVEVDCANCAAKMEEAVKNTEGVKDATLSFMTLKLKVEFEDGADVKEVMAKAYKNCKAVEDDCEIFL